MQNFKNFILNFAIFRLIYKVCVHKSNQIKSNDLIKQNHFSGALWPAEGLMSPKLTKFMARSGVGAYCNSQGWKEAQCIKSVSCKTFCSLSLLWNRKSLSILFCQKIPCINLWRKIKCSDKCKTNIKYQMLIRWNENIITDCSKKISKSPCYSALVLPRKERTQENSSVSWFILPKFCMNSFDNKVIAFYYLTFWVVHQKRENINAEYISGLYNKSDKPY